MYVFMYLLVVILRIFPYRNITYLLPLHVMRYHIACVQHTQKLAQRHTHATYMHMRSHTCEYMYATRV